MGLAIRPAQSLRRSLRPDVEDLLDIPSKDDGFQLIQNNTSRYDSESGATPRGPLLVTYRKDGKTVREINDEERIIHVLELFKFLLEKLDFVSVAEAVRKRGNRRAAARLHLILVQSYEIMELYGILLDELRAAIDEHEQVDGRHRFYLNPSRVASLLARQSSNLAVMDTLVRDLLDELRVLDNQFAETYRSILPGKSGILFEAECLLASGRFPLAETDPPEFPASADGAYRTLWFTAEAPKEDRQEIEKYLYGWNGQEKTVMDVNVHDGDAFFEAIREYFRMEDPLGRLRDLKSVTEGYREVLLRTFTLEDLLSEIPKVRRHYGSLP